MHSKITLFLVSLKCLLILITLYTKILKLHHHHYHLHYYYVSWAAPSPISFIQYLCSCQGGAWYFSLLCHILLNSACLFSLSRPFCVLILPSSILTVSSSFVSSENAISNDDHYFHVIKSLIKMMNKKEQTAGNLAADYSPLPPGWF